MGRRRCSIAFFESPVARWDAKSELPVVGNPTTEMGLCRTDTGQVIDTEGVTPKRLKAREVQGVPEAEPAQVEPIMSTGVAQAATDAGLAQEWPREPDASAKEAQVGKPGRGLPPVGRDDAL